VVTAAAAPNVNSLGQTAIAGYSAHYLSGSRGNRPLLASGLRLEKKQPSITRRDLCVPAIAFSSDQCTMSRLEFT